MPIIDLTDRTTGEEAEFESNVKSDKSLIYLSPAESKESYSIELTLGDRWSEKYGVGDSTMYAIPAEGIKVLKRDSVVVEVREKIFMPHNAYGVVVPTGSLFLQRGVLIGSGKIEPNFRGKLKLRLFNTTQKRLVLQPGAKLASGLIFVTEGTKSHPVAITKETTLEKKIPFGQRARKWAATNWQQIITWIIPIIFGGVGGAVVTLWLT